MAGALFRQKTIDKVSSPEELNDYIKASNVGVWMILSSVVILLAGVCVWGIFGHLDSAITTAAVCRDGIMTVYIKETDIEHVRQGMGVRVNGEEYMITSVSSMPQEAGGEMDPYAIHVGGFEQDDWVFMATVEASAGDGVYEALITTESVSPASFIIN